MVETQQGRNTLVKIAWIDARHPMANQELWGLTLLERNLRQLDRLGIEEAIVLMAPGNAPRKHFFYPLSSRLKTTFVTSERADPFQSLRFNLEKNGHPILILEGNAIHDNRILKKLIGSASSLAATTGEGDDSVAAAVLWSDHARLFMENGHSRVSSVLNQATPSQIPNLDLVEVDSYVPGLRSHVEPYLLLVERPEHMQTANRLLKTAVHKGVNDFVAKYLHPPLEFAGARFLARIRVTPNQVTIAGIISSVFVTYLFATGHLFWGALLAAIKGVLDGIDGKLARLTLRFSKYGEWLDHVGDTIFDGLWYLALGWHFSNGDLNSTGAQFALILFVSYVVERIVPGVFKKLHGVEIYDYKTVDRVMRLIGSRINNNIWIFLLAVIVGLAREAFLAISIWMLLTASWHTVRLIYVTVRRQ